MTPTLTTDTHRGNVANILSKHTWMDCHDVAQALSWSPDSASSVLSDNHRAGYVERRETNNPNGPDYEYRLKENVRIKTDS